MIPMVTLWTSPSEFTRVGRGMRNLAAMLFLPVTLLVFSLTLRGDCGGAGAREVGGPPGEEEGEGRSEAELELWSVPACEEVADFAFPKPITDVTALSPLVSDRRNPPAPPPPLWLSVTALWRLSDTATVPETPPAESSDLFLSVVPLLSLLRLSAEPPCRMSATALHTMACCSLGGSCLPREGEEFESDILTPLQSSPVLCRISPLYVSSIARSFESIRRS
mmetsp:Transcript_1076/g.3860  ORF Transcript_1076/g.3860 Transcript_1076/m.3860 type:complete len:222 (-) Transcript_1076:574-1239(-)